DHAFRIARQIRRNTMAPIVAVIRLPQKSGTTSSRSFSKRKPPTMAPTSPTARLYNKPLRPPRIWVASQPASNPIMIQAMTPMVFSRIKVRRESEIYTTGGEMRALPGSLPAPTNAVTKTPRRRSKTSGHVLILGVYTLAVFLSASLLFGVQPMFARMALPRLGGSPSVWSVAMVFFQSMLLAGYAYAHILMTARNRYVPVAVHLALLCVAAFTLPLAISDSWGEPLTGAAA